MGPGGPGGGAPERTPRLNPSPSYASGLLLLLQGAAQLDLIGRVARILKPRGRFLFTAPLGAGSLNDAITNLESRSLGREAYEKALTGSGFRLVATYEDEGANNYYDAEKLG